MPESPVLIAWSRHLSTPIGGGRTHRREEFSKAGLGRDIWQFPVVLLGDVRSGGVQGDRRTYGHPIVLHPVTSEDAMIARWARLPYDVVEAISTRITNEVRKVSARSGGNAGKSTYSVSGWRIEQAVSWLRRK